MKLARFVDEMLSSFPLALSILKTVNLMDPTQLTPRRIVHFRMPIEAIFENSDTLVLEHFTCAAVASELELLRSGLRFFVKQYTVASNIGKNIDGKSIIES